MAKTATCHKCIYAHWDPGLWLRTLWSGFPARPMCANQADSFGRMKECPLGQVCRNYRSRPPTPTGENVKMISLTGGFYAYVDAADYEELSQWHWLAYGRYAGRNVNGKRIFMHRQIMQTPEGMVVGHINGNGFDNTRVNMRNVTPGENASNARKRVGTTSIYKGVGRDRRQGMWHARVYFMGEPILLGRFADEREAARAYDRMAVELFGEVAA
jgi:hypothetical protein